MINKTYEYRIFPTKSAFLAYENTLKVCWNIYNYCITQCRLFYDLYGKSLKKSDLQKSLVGLKKFIPSYDYVYSQVAQDVTYRVERAYQNYFDGQKEGRYVGIPKLKKLEDYRSFTYKQNTGFAILDRPTSKRFKTLRLGKLGLVKMEYHRELPSKPKMCRIVKKYGKYFAQFIVEVPEELPLCDKKNKSLGCDPGLKNSITFSDGKHIKAFRKSPHLKDAKEKVKAIQKELSENYKEKKKQWKKSNYKRVSELKEERQTIRRKLRRANYRVYNIKKDAIHKTALRVAKRCRTLFLEDIGIKELMSRKGVNKKKKKLRALFQESALSRLLTTIENKFLSCGQSVIRVESKYTTQACSKCGALTYKSLEERTHRCRVCGYTEDRDINAAKVIKAIGKGSLTITHEEIVKYNEAKRFAEENA